MNFCKDIAIIDFDYVFMFMDKYLHNFVHDLHHISYLSAIMIVDMCIMIFVCKFASRGDGWNICPNTTKEPLVKLKRLLI